MPNSKHNRPWPIILPAVAVALAAVVMAVAVIAMQRSRSPVPAAAELGASPALAVAEPAVEPAQAGPVPAAEPRPAAKIHLAAAGRSPMPQPGETFKTLIPAPRFDDKAPTAKPIPKRSGQSAASTPPPAASDEVPVVPWDKAGEHVDRVITAEGVVADTHNTGSVCFLNFVAGRRDLFYVIIFEDQLNAWPEPPERWFLNKKIRATGKVYLHKGRAQVRIEDARQITVVE